MTQKEAAKQGVLKLRAGGSTYMEAGLTLGYELARESSRSFAGNTRVMLFTDERPNVGRTHKDSFMGMARDASQQGVGLTTIGVGRTSSSAISAAGSGAKGTPSPAIV